MDNWHKTQILPNNKKATSFFSICKSSSRGSERNYTALIKHLGAFWCWYPPQRITLDYHLIFSERVKEGANHKYTEGTIQ